jgi:hypothetical protein
MSDHDNWKKIHTRRAISYSKKHNCIVQVRQVIKGRGKGRFDDYIPGDISGWWTDSVLKVIAIYKNGVKIK